MEVLIHFSPSRPVMQRSGHGLWAVRHRSLPLPGIRDVQAVLSISRPTRMGERGEKMAPWHSAEGLVRPLTSSPLEALMALDSLDPVFLDSFQGVPRRSCVRHAERISGIHPVPKQCDDLAGRLPALPSQADELVVVLQLREGHAGTMAAVRQAAYACLAVSRKVYTCCMRL